MVRQIFDFGPTLVVLYQDALISMLSGRNKLYYGGIYPNLCDTTLAYKDSFVWADHIVGDKTKEDNKP
jgi:hypothetical protein